MLLQVNIHSHTKLSLEHSESLQDHLSTMKRLYYTFQYHVQYTYTLHTGPSTYMQ